MIAKEVVLIASVFAFLSSCAISGISGSSGSSSSTPVSGTQTNYYVDGSRPDDSGDGMSWATAKKYIQSGIALMAGGDVLNVKNGTYSGANNRIDNLPAGTSGAYTTVRAESDFGVVIADVTAGYYHCRSQSDSVMIRGFLLEGSGMHCIMEGSSNIVIRCGSSGVISGNGASFNASGDDQLFEECFSYGGGRYPIRTAQSSAQFVVFRRCLVRWDYSYTTEPCASFGNYDCSNVYYQNCVSIDGLDIRQSDYTYDGLKSFFTPNGAHETHFHGCLSLNVEGTAFWIEDSPVANVTLTDCVGWATRNNRTPAGFSDGYMKYLFYARGGTGPLEINRCTFGGTDVSGQTYHAVSANGALNNDTIKNTLLVHVTTSAGQFALGSGWSLEDYNCFYGNTSARDTAAVPGSHDFCVSNGNELDPLSNGLTYLIRIESSTSLKTAGESGGQIGAEILYRIGRDADGDGICGLLYGETGWNELQNGSGASGVRHLWPWPNETVIRDECRSFSKTADELWAGSPAMSGNRGFCADGQTLTKYIWEYLGNTIPAGIY